MMKWRTFARVTGDYVELDPGTGRRDSPESVEQTILKYSIDYVEDWPYFVEMLSSSEWFPVEIEE